MLQPPPTSTGQPRLSEAARFLVAPSDIVSTGWPAVRQTCEAKLGITFDPWQDGAGRLILAKRADGNLAAMIDGVGMSVPRQVGKTYLVGALVFALCILMPGLLVIWTAHHLKTSGETFLALQGFASRRRVAPFIKYVHTGSGDEEIAFRNGSRILFGARERGFGRGIPGVDVLIFDEAQILSDKAMANMLATLNTSRFGLQLYVGTPPKPEDMSESFKRMRREARAGTLLDGAWIELGADPDADLDDRAQWRMANPSYPKRTPAQSLLRLKRKLTLADWRREGMGIWDDDATTSSLIPAARWSGLRVYEAPPGTVGYGVKFSADGSRVALAVAVRPDDDSPVHVEVVRSESMALGTAWLVDWLSTRWRGCLGIAIDGKSGSGQLVNALRAARVPARVIVIPTLDQVISAHAMLLEAVVSDPAGVSHFGQAGLGDAVAGATKRPIGKSGGWGWAPIGDAVDVTPLEAVTFAHLVAATNRRKVSSGSSNGRRVVVLS